MLQLGDNTLAASDDNSMAAAASTAVTLTRHRLFTGLTPGSTTFALNYRTTATAATMTRRSLSVIPLG